MKLYIYLVIVAITLGGFGVYSYLIYQAGREAERAQNRIAIEKEKQKQRKLLKQLEAANEKQRIVVREKIKVVRSTQDSTGCTDARVPSDILNQLH